MSLSDRINEISDKALELEQENERLKTENKALQEQLKLQGENQNLNLLLDAVATMANLYRVRFETLPGNTQQVIQAYDRYVEGCER